MKWKKLGRIFDPNIMRDKGLTASLMPIVEDIDSSKGIVRVYFSPRDKNNCSEVHWFEISLNSPYKIIRQAKDAIFQKGKTGAFDDSGITLGSIVSNGTEKLLFYTGWNLTVTVPMNNSIGIARFSSKGKLCRYGEGPIMTRNLHEPYSCASPFVLFEDGRYRMWYASMDKWDDSNDAIRHYYNIKYAESTNGLNWIRHQHVCIDYNNDEYAFGRPFVSKENNIYKMWYAYRGDFYRIGYAESPDGLNWVRKDHICGIKTSESGWDSEMIEYPFIHDCLGNRYLFYNGNSYGKSGIGLAILEKDF